MKLAALKNMNWKEFGIDHGEKILLGLIAFLMSLALIFAPWKPESRRPEELKSKVAESKTKVESGIWPDEEKQKYQPKNTIGELVGQLLTPVDVSRYTYSHDIFWPLVRRQEPIREPEWVTVEDPIVSGGRVTIVFSPALAVEDGAEMADGEADGGRNADNEFGVRRGNAGGAAGGALGAAAGAGVVGAPRIPGAGPAAPGAVLGAGAAGEYGAGAGGGSQGEFGRGFRFASLRAVVPLKKQAEKIARASNIPLLKAYDLVQYLDFEIERKKAVEGKDPWAGEWEKVDIKHALEVVRDANFEDEVVDISITDPAVTMPLPERAQGNWDRYATHPRLKEFALSEEGKELQRQLTEKVLEFEKQSQMNDGKQPPQRGGFSNLQKNVRGLQREIATSSNNFSGFDRFLGNPGGVLGMPAMPGQGPADRMTNERFKKKIEVTAAGQYLLFRYFDFDVEPGNAYRYRIRLTLNNPNFNLSPDQIIDAFVAENPTRSTPWSVESNPIVIGDDVQYFLSKVENPRTGKPQAHFDVYQWNADNGIPVHEPELAAVYGQPIAEVKKDVKIVMPPSTVETKDFTFTTGDLLVDANDALPTFDSATVGFHRDLKLSSDPKQRKLFTDRALVVNDFGELTTLDPQSTLARADRTKKRFQEWTREWDDLEEKKVETNGSALDAAMPPGMSAPEDRGAKKSKKRNATKTAGAATAVLGAGMPAHPPAAGGAGGAGGGKRSR